MDEITATVRMDASGRLVIPAQARRAAGFQEGEVDLAASQGQVILRPARKNAEAIKRWQEQLLATKLVPTGKLGKDEGKWMSDDYARRKLGL